MAYCNTCIFYSETADNLNREYNDIGAENAHYCPMYTDTIPDGIFEGEKECPEYTPKQ